MKNPDSSQSTKIAFFISSHGFGHAARATAVMQAIKRILETVRFEIFTKVPSWFFKETINSDFCYHEMLTDIGIIQETPLQENLPATVKALSSFLPFDDKQISKVANQLLLEDCQLVLCDISIMGIASARLAGIPSVLIENFTWDWIYEPYTEEYPEFSKYIPIFEKLFNSADYHIQTTPYCVPAHNAIMRTHPVGRKPTTDRETTRHQLGIPDGGKMILITMGGIEHQFSSLENLQFSNNEFFVIPGGSKIEQKHGQLILLPHHSRFYHPDLISASDAIIGKAGYSTIAEVYHGGLPFGYITRPNFRESEPLAEFLKSTTNGFEIKESEFVSGNWLARIPDLLSFPIQKNGKPNGSDQIAEFVINHL